LVDPTQSGLLGSAGEYGWAGAYSTYFWVDPREQLIGVLMLQSDPANLRYSWLFQSLAYQALVA
jgi:CubicO group peptidase (beta-lactamase class C family)